MVSAVVGEREVVSAAAAVGEREVVSFTPSVVGLTVWKTFPETEFRNSLLMKICFDIDVYVCLCTYILKDTIISIKSVTTFK